MARLRAAVSVEGKTGIVYGPTSPPRAAIQPYASQANVLAERGVPTRTEWNPRGNVLYYGRERWSFDQKGQPAGRPARPVSHPRRRPAAIARSISRFSLRSRIAARLS